MICDYYKKVNWCTIMTHIENVVFDKNEILDYNNSARRKYGVHS